MVKLSSILVLEDRTTERVNFQPISIDNIKWTNQKKGFVDFHKFFKTAQYFFCYNKKVFLKKKKKKKKKKKIKMSFSQSEYLPKSINKKF